MVGWSAGDVGSLVRGCVVAWFCCVGHDGDDAIVVL